jgi:hypothetical protein
VGGAPFSDVPDKKGWLPDIAGLKCDRFPAVVQVHPAAIEGADLSVAVNEKLVELIVGDLFSQPIEIPLSGDSTNSMSDHYIIVNRIRNMSLRADNMIDVGVAGDIWFRNHLLKTKLSVRDLELVISPFIVKKDTSFYFNFPAQITSLDIQGIPATMDICLANFISEKGYLNHDTLDITKSLAIRIANPLDTPYNIAPRIDQAQIISNNRNYRVVIKTK